MFRTWPAIFLILLNTAALAANSPAPDLTATRPERRVQQVLPVLKRASQFVNVPHVSARSSCEETQPPQALATPNPLFSSTSFGRKVKVSFIIGTDGHVHSPLILESSGLLGDWHVLQAVRTWRYRPATCNGVPTEIEAKIEFSSR